MEFLVRFEIKVPPELDGEKLDKIMAEEKRRGDLLWSSGRLLRIWRVPGRRASIALYDFPMPPNCTPRCPPCPFSRT